MSFKDLYGLVERLNEDRVDDLILDLKNEGPDVRTDAAKDLGRLRTPRAVEPLIATMMDEDEDSFVRAMATKALGLIKDPRAFEPLTAVLADKDEDVRSEAAKALRRLGVKERRINEVHILGAIEKAKVKKMLWDIGSKTEDLKSYISNEVPFIRHSIEWDNIDRGFTQIFNTIEAIGKTVNELGKKDYRHKII